MQRTRIELPPVDACSAEISATWDVPIERVPLAFLDLEMTGLDPARDRVIEVCVERCEGERLVERFESLVAYRELLDDPAACVGNEAIHGISRGMLEGAPSFVEVLPKVLSMLEGAVLVAHGARYDVAFLRAEIERAGLTAATFYYLDTLNLSRRALGLASHSLEALARHFGLHRDVAHRAAADVAMLRQVFARVVTVLRPKSARDLWDVRVGEGRAREVVLTACRLAMAEKRAVLIHYRPAGRAAARFAFVVTQVTETQEAPLVVGYERDTRSRRELRADRILAVEPGN